MTFLGWLLLAIGGTAGLVAIAYRLVFESTEAESPRDSLPAQA